MKIDDKKEITPFRDDSRNRERVYTDHRTITIELKLNLKNELMPKKIIVNQKNMQRFNEATEKEDLKSIWKNEEIDIEKKYNIWNDKVKQILVDVCKREKKGKI